MPGDSDHNSEGVGEPVSNIVRFPSKERFPARLELTMTKTEKALHIRRKILVDDLPEQLLDEMLRLLDEQERRSVEP